MVRIVPVALREAALALGYPRWRTSLTIVLRTARAGIVTGALVAVARIAGETAPLLFTAFGNQFWSVSLRRSRSRRFPCRSSLTRSVPMTTWHSPRLGRRARPHRARLRHQPRRPFRHARPLHDRRWRLNARICSDDVSLIETASRRAGYRRRACASPRSTRTSAACTRCAGSACDSTIGEVTAIIGPSGCGKSTFLRCLNRMHETVPTARVEGEVRARRRGHLRPRRERDRGAPAHRDGLPAPHALPHDVHSRQRRRGAAGAATARGRRAARRTRSSRRRSCAPRSGTR